MVQLQSLAWLGCESQAMTSGCCFLSERVGVNAARGASQLEPELLKVNAKPEEPPPSCHDSEVCVSIAVAVSAGPDFPALSVAVAVFVLGC